MDMLYNHTGDVYAVIYEIVYEGEQYSVFDARRMTRFETDSDTDEFKLWPEGFYYYKWTRREQYDYYCEQTPSE